MPASVNWQSTTYGNGVFVAVVYNSTTAASSTDGITWALRTMPASVQWYSTTYGNGVFLAIAAGTTTAASSTDGITWTLRTMPASAYWYSTTYGNGVFLAVVSSSTTAASSTDGITWTLRTLPTTASWEIIVSGNVQDNEIIYKNIFIAANTTINLDANKYDPILVPESYSLIPQSSSTAVNFMLSGEKWLNT